MSIKTLTAKLKRFLDRDEGAVTVDFVVLMSMICLFALAVLITVGNATSTTANRISGTIATMSVWNY